MISISEEFIEPGDNDYQILTWYDNNTRVEVVTRKNNKTNFLSKYRRISANEYFNPRTKQIEKYKKKRTKNSQKAFGILKRSSLLLLNNIEGNNTEKLIKASFNKKQKDTKVVMKVFNEFFKKLKKHIPPIMYIRIWIYPGMHYPICHLWLKTIDNSKLEISQELLEKLWGETGTVEQVEITKENREKITNYCSVNKKSYPHNLHILYASKGIKPPFKEEVTHKVAKEKLKGFERVYASATAQKEKIDDRYIELQRTSYEGYIKVKDIKPLRLNIETKSNKYTGIIKKGIYAKQQEQKRIETEKEERFFQEFQRLLKEINYDKKYAVTRTNKQNEYNFIIKDTGEVIAMHHLEIYLDGLRKTVKNYKESKKKQKAI